ncbi:MAG: histidinol phosphate phosphatase domain-containing protein [Desulfovibrionaceae bacterium]
MIDLHTHTVFSDGVLVPAEHLRRAKVAGYRGLALTDHADPSNMAFILEHTLRLARQYGPFFDVEVLAGVELTHLPPGLVPEMVDQARDMGAQIVVVHGETVVEPVPQGTNLAAIEAGADVLAHPGLITEVEVELAAEKGVALEITTRKGHSLTNGRVAALARRFGARLVINNDAHGPSDFVSRDMRRAVALGAGMSEEELRAADQTSLEIFQKSLKK